jgi:GTPase
MFDKVEITLKAGNGGDGVVSFRHEKYVPFGGPDGGDGGKGGDVVFVADSGITDFRFFHNKGIYKASDGMRGSGKKKRGKDGDTLVLMVPVGTVMLRKAEIGGQGTIADLEHDGQRIVVLHGGKGGLGNTHFTTSIRQAPRFAQKGEIGQEITVVLDLRLIADVGIIGYPNAGKSSLLAAASAAKPEIADYPFTTKEPVLGVVYVNYDNYVLAEIPGLIDGAHQGRGLGHDFLQHAMRTRIFIHLINGTSKSPVGDMIAVNNELSLFDSALGKKQQIVAVNKIDLPEVKDKIPLIRESFKQAGIDVVFISAVTKEGVSKLMSLVWDKLQIVLKETPHEKEQPVKVFKPQPRGMNFSVRKEGNTFVVDAPDLARLVSGTGQQTPELFSHVYERLSKAGLDKVLRKAGAQPGDKVRCGSVEWEF